MKLFIKYTLLSCLVSMFLLDTAMGQLLRRNAPARDNPVAINAQNARFVELQIPTGTVLETANFSPDGTKIVAGGNETHRVGHQIVNTGSAIF